MHFRVQVRTACLGLGLSLGACSALPQLAGRSGNWLLLLLPGLAAPEQGLISAEVSGIAGQGLTVQVNEAPPLSIYRDGAFAVGWNDGEQVPSIRILQQPQRPDQSCRVARQAGNAFQIHCADEAAPELLGAAIVNPRRIRLHFTRYLAEDAGAVAAYRIAAGTTLGSCSDNSNFENAIPTADFVVQSAAAAGNYVELQLSAPIREGVVYTAFADRTRVRDRAETPNLLGCSNQAELRLDAAPRLIEARCSGDARSVVLAFSRPFSRPVNAPGSALCTGAACATRFRMQGATSNFEILSAARPDGTNCAGMPADASDTRLCLTHAGVQGGENYTIIAANNRDSDGFYNSACGDGVCAIVSDYASPGGTIPLSPGDPPADRATFAGCGGRLPALEQGALAVNPFADFATFGYLASFDGRIITGPGANGNVAMRFRPDGADPQILSFRFERDVTGASLETRHANLGGAGATYRSIGATGCQANNADPLRGCGPNNEDGRGYFTSGRMNGREYLFLTGARSAGDNDYVYFAENVGERTEFRYMDLSDSFDNIWSGPNIDNRGVESIHAHNNRLYVMMPGDNMNRPYFVKVNRLENEIVEGDSGAWMHLGLAPGFGRRAWPKIAMADHLGGSVFSFRDRVYVMNSGSVLQTTTGHYAGCWPGDEAPECINNGGMVRSVNNDPRPCDPATGGCADWLDITPNNAWFTNFFSVVLTSLSDLIPAQRPFPAAAEYSGNFFVIRNACEVNMVGSMCDLSRHDCALDDITCPAGREVPQLWKCEPGLSGAVEGCDSADWSPVAMDAGGRTNFGDPNNRAASLLAVSGNRLYVGFDNLSGGVQLWRTRSGATNPVQSADFEPVGGAGFGAPLLQRRIFSSIAISGAGRNFLYLTTGQAAGGMSLFVTPTGP